MRDILSNYSFKNCTCGLQKLFCVRRDQAKLLVYGPTDPILSKNRKNNITKFWPTDFFLIYYFLLYFFIQKKTKGKRKKSITNLQEYPKPTSI